jgi:hypothetical protein
MGRGGLGRAQEGTQETQSAAVQAGLELGREAANDRQRRPNDESRGQMHSDMGTPGRLNLP